MCDNDTEFTHLPDFNIGESVIVHWALGEELYEFVTSVVFVGETPMHFFVGVYTDRGISCLHILKSEQTEKVKCWTDICWSISHDGIRNNVKIERID